MGSPHSEDSHVTTDGVREFVHYEPLPKRIMEYVLLPGILSLYFV